MSPQPPDLRPRLAGDGTALALRSGELVRGGERARLWTGAIGIGTTLIAGGALALAAPGSPLLAARTQIPLTPAMQGPFASSDLTLGAGGCALLIALMLAGYLAALRGARALPAGPVLAVIVTLHVVFALAPPLFSSDIFSYVAYGRMGTLHALSPYLHGPSAIPSDPSYPFTGLTWIHTPSVYGPLFTGLSYLLAPLGLIGAMWSFKLLAAAASLACVALVWSCARHRGLPPLPAALMVGLNPLLLIWAVGGGHNDLITVALLLAGVRLALTRHPANSTIAIVSAAAIKLSGAIVLPYLVLGMHGAQRRRALVASALAIGGIVLATLIAFGTAPFSLGRTIGTNAGDWHSLPGLLTRLTGTQTTTSTERLLLTLTTAAICIELARRVWRHRLDWLTAAGWATLFTLLLSPVLLPWYTVWLTPLATLGNRRLRHAALAFTAITLTVRLLDFIPPELHTLGVRPPIT